jgi:hypothetical protein
LNKVVNLNDIVGKLKLSAEGDKNLNLTEEEISYLGGIDKVKIGKISPNNNDDNNHGGIKVEESGGLLLNLLIGLIFGATAIMAIILIKNIFGRGEDLVNKKKK